MSLLHEAEEGQQPAEPLELPLERIDAELLRRMIEEFVTRDWCEPADSACTLDEKVGQVLGQLQARRARIVYDSVSESWDIVPCR